MAWLVRKIVSLCGLNNLQLRRRKTRRPREGQVRVCVGRKCSSFFQVFDLDVNFLNHPLFEDLLEISVDEFGYSYSGALRIACEVELFLHLIQLLRSSDPSVHYMEIQDIVGSFQTKNI